MDGLVSPAGSVGARRSPLATSAPRHAPHAEASTPVTTKKERQADACLSFLAGAEGLEPSARGFGVDVEKCTREQGRGGVVRFLPQDQKRVVLVWCCEKNPRQKREGKPPWATSKFAVE